MRLFVVVAALALFSFASAVEVSTDLVAPDMGHLQVGSVETFEIENAPMGTYQLDHLVMQKLQNQLDNNPDRKIDPAVVINIAKQIWDFIKEGEPVLDIEVDYGDAVPQGIERWDQMFGWQGPSVKTYKTVWKDKFGREIFVLVFRIMWSHHGKIQQSSGLYVHHAQFVPAEIKVGWGWSVSALCRVPEVLNIGTHNSPIGGVHLRLIYNLSSIMEKHHRELDYFVSGDGNFKDLNK